MTYSEICKKLGFDPVVDGYDYKYSGHEDDSQISPFSILTDEESDFLLNYMIAHRKEMNQKNKGIVHRYGAFSMPIFSKLIRKEATVREFRTVAFYISTTERRKQK